MSWNWLGWWPWRSPLGPQPRGPIDNGFIPEPLRYDEQLKLSAVYACLKLISTTCAGIKPTLMREDGTTMPRKEARKSCEVFRLISYKTQPSLSGYLFRLRVFLDLAACQNHYSRRIKDANKLTIALDPLPSAQIVTERTSSGLVHMYTTDKGTEKLSEADVFYVRGFGDGFTGYSAHAYGANSAAIAKSAADLVGQMYGNGMRPAGVLTTDSVLTAPQAAAIKQNFEDITSGKQGKRLWLLEAAMKYQPTQLDLEAAQLLATRRFQIEETCRFFGVPPFLIFENSTTTQLGSSVEQLMLAWNRTGIQPLVDAFEDAFNTQLLTPGELERYELQLDTREAAERSVDSKTRAETNSIMIQSGQLTPNEARALAGRSSANGGDQLFMQGALAPAATLAAKPL